MIKSNLTQRESKCRLRRQRDEERKVEKFRRKTNNFERFFRDSTLTSLTSGNTFRLVILPTRRAVFPGCAPSFSWMRTQFFLDAHLVFLRCASKTPVFKGKVTKKGGAEAPPISLYKYNTFRRLKQEVLKPKNRLGCGKIWMKKKRI